MSNTILDYAVQFDQITALAKPSTGFLHNLAIVITNVAAPAAPGYVMIDVDTVEDLAQYSPVYAEQMKGAFDGGLNKITLIMVDAITDLPAAITEGFDAYTLFGSPEFTAVEFMANSISFAGVRAFVDFDQALIEAHVATVNVCGFYSEGAVADIYNPLRAFGELLSAPFWTNQQYVNSTSDVGTVKTLGLAETLFDDRISFWMSDLTSGIRLGFFVAGGMSITTPYITKEVELELQYRSHNHIVVNQPFKIQVEIAQLERIGQKVLSGYVSIGYLDGGAVNTYKVMDLGELFVVNAELTTSPSVALWRMRISAVQTQG